jgi:hypothetical protein
MGGSFLYRRFGDESIREAVRITDRPVGQLLEDRHVDVKKKTRFVLWCFLNIERPMRWSLRGPLELGRIPYWKLDVQRSMLDALYNLA